ncbi:MAG: sn-glycerol-3-phosphate ABC transporter ATP-binding protein UgpC [Azospirillaceae bacterium]
MATLTLSGVDKAYDKLQVVHGVDLDIADGEFVVFVGPSGCGKSTLLRMIAGLEEITAGTVAIDGRRVNELSPAERGIAMVFQTYALYPHKDVYGNMAFALKHAGVDRQTIDERVRMAAEILGLEPLLKRRPKQLSGGQRQRVAIGRAIVRDPKIFLFDEPLSNLDAALRVQMRVEILKLHQRLRSTMVYVTHDQVEAMTLADRIVVLNGGVVEQVGTPMALYHHPANRFVAEFIGSPRMNLMPARPVGRENGSAVVEIAGGARLSIPVDPAENGAVGDDWQLGVRPEHLAVTAPDAAAGQPGALSGAVTVVERLGGETLVHAAIDGADTLVVKAGGDASLRLGDRIAVVPALDECHLFDAAGRALAKPRRAALDVERPRHDA